MIKIAITGVHGSGKTTLVNKMAKEYREQGKTVFIVNEVARRCPYLRGSIRGQAWIWHEQYQQELDAKASDAEIILCDRTLMDNIVYSAHLLAKGKYIPDHFNFLLAATRGWMKTYDKIIRLPLNINRIMNDLDDDVRPKSSKYAEEIESLFDEFVDDYATEKR